MKKKINHFIYWLFYPLIKSILFALPYSSFGARILAWFIENDDDIYGETK